MNKFWKALKSIATKLLQWLRHKPPTQKEMDSPIELKEQSKAPRIKLNMPNMPKYQPCTNGHGWKKRERKTVGGAYYRCNKCGDFFVRAVR